MRDRVQQLSSTLRQELRLRGFNTGASESHIIPVILGTNEVAVEFAESLAVAGFTVRAIRPPSVPPGTARLRISVTANLSRENLSAFIDRVSRVRDRLGVPAAALGRS